MTAPLVSVVIATYNAHAFIRSTLQSILGQTYRPVEVIVVDDGSTDGTCDLVTAEFPSVRLIRQQNQRVCAARNNGLAASTGSLICFCDHDDHWHPEKLARQVAQFERDPALGIVYTAFKVWSPGPDGQLPAPETMGVSVEDESIDPSLSGWIYPQLLLDCWVLTSTAMIRREALDKVGAFDVTLPYAEDWDLWLRLSREYRFSKLAAPLVLYRQHASQGSRMYRKIDYRTRLLRQAVARWGLVGPDGVAQDRKRFYHQLGYYHVSDGFHALREGFRGAAARSFWRGWTCEPWRLKYLLYIVAGWLGWKPSW